MTIFSLLIQKINHSHNNSIQFKKSNFIDNYFFDLSKLSLIRIDLFYPLKRWLDNIEIKDSTTAHRICKLIPSQCPFARDIIIFNHKIATIPPLCKLNPLYQNLMDLKFRSMVYLTDICGEDISAYC